MPNMEDDDARPDDLEQLDVELKIGGRQSGLVLPEPEMVAESQVMLAVVAQLRRAARIQFLPVLLTGETGAGKKEAALFLHRTSEFIHGHAGQFAEVNCSAIPETLLESELFGHEKGAFTGAIDRKPGLLEMGADGSLLLDEIGDANLKVQMRLLKFLEEGELVRVGGVRPIKVKTRVITATHRDLAKETAAGQFRQDLLYRLNVFPIHVPPLRQRKQELASLVSECIRRFNDNHMTGVRTRVDASVLELLEQHSWPGNIRELFNTVERAIVNHGGEGALMVTDFLLPEVEENPSISTLLGWEAPHVDDGVTLAEVEKRYISGMLRRHRFNKRKTATILGVYRPTLYNKLKQHGIETIAKPKTTKEP